jgi:acetylornithine deacetylase
MKNGEYIELLIEMLSIPALSRKEESRADFLENWCRKKGLTLMRTGNNLVVTGGEDPASASVMLNSHMDTVSPGNGWDSDPFVPVTDNGAITGLGSNDAGASVISMISAYLDLVERKMANKIVLVISAEEEVSGENGISAVLPALRNLKLAIIGEPTSMQPAVAERGLMVIDAMAKGVAGHAARNEGENAIYKAMTDINTIRNLTFDEPSEWLSSPSVNITMIDAGTAHNVVPAICKFVIDVRSNDRYPNKRLLNLLKAKCNSELSARSLRLNSSFLTQGHPVYKILFQLGLTPYGSPTLSDMALLNVPAVKIGPGDSARSHTANEYIRVSEIDHAVEVYTALLEKIVNLAL